MACVITVITITITSIVLVARELRHERLDRDLLYAIEAKDDSMALSLLQEGADGDTRESVDRQITFRDALKQVVNRVMHPGVRRGGSTVDNRDVLLLYYELASASSGPYGPFTAGERLPLALLDSGATAYGTTWSDWTALNYAVRCGHHVVVRRLLVAHADVNNRDSLLGEFPLDEADAQDTKALLDHRANIEQKITVGARTAVFDAGGAKLDIMLDHGANIEAVDQAGMTPLIFDCRLRAGDHLATLLKRGADVTKRDRTGETALLAGAEGLKLEAIQALVRSGADPCARDNSGNTALMLSATNTDTRVFPWLLSRGVDLNARGQGGNTALHVAEHCFCDSAYWGENLEGYYPKRSAYLREIKMLKRHGAVATRSTAAWTTADY